MNRFAIGLGCDRGVALQTMRDAVQAALDAAGATHGQVAAAASIVLKRDEAALLALAAEHGWPLRFYEAAALARVTVPHPSETVRRHTGTPSVSEAAALLAAGMALGTAAGMAAPMTALVVEKHKHRGADGRNATVSIARIDS